MFAAVDYWTTSITLIGISLSFALVRCLGGTRWFPRLPPAEPGHEPTWNDRLRYYGANLLALLCGAAVAVVLAETTRLPPHEFRYSVFDGSGRWIGPAFVGLGLAGWLAMLLIDRLVAPATLVHILHRANKGRLTGIDMRPATRKLGLGVAALAVVLHYTLRINHTTLADDGVRWRDWPWQEEQVQPWSAVRDVRIVRTFTATSGRVVERPHLGIEFADGTVVHVGKRDDKHVDGYWEAPAALAAGRSGLTVRHVAHD